MLAKLTTVILLVSAVPALAQQSPQQSVQDQLVSVYVNLNSSLAKQLDTANATIADLQKKLADEQAMRDSIAAGPCDAVVESDM